MIFVLLFTVFASFLTSIWHFVKKKKTIVEVLFYLSWFLTIFCMVLTVEYSHLLSDSLDFTVILMFFVLLTVIPPLLYHIVFRYQSKDKFDIRNYFLTGLLFITNIFYIIFFHIKTDNTDDIYIIVENLMTYSNYITTLLIFPSYVIYYSYLSYKLIHPISLKSIKKPKNTKDYLFIFILFFNLHMLAWYLSVYILSDSFLSNLLEVFNCTYFLGSYFLLYKITQLENTDDVIENGFNINVSEINEKIIKAIEERKIFLDTKLTVKTLAKEVNSNEKYVSYVINSIYNKSFSSYINDYRVDYAKKALLDEEYDNYTITAIGEMSGFNSKSGFNTTFKKYTSLTPTQFKKKNKK